MTLKSSITQSVMSVTMTGLAFSASAIDIHAVSDFGDYVIDNGTSVRFVQVDDSLQNNNFEISLGEETKVSGLQLYAAYSDQKGEAPVVNNRLVWVDGQIGSVSQPSDAILYAAYADEADLHNNQLIVEGGVFYPLTRGGYTYGKLIAAGGDNGDMHGNTVTITGGQFFSNFDVIAAYSGLRSGRFQTAQNNHVIVDGSSGRVKFLPYEAFTEENYQEVGERAASVYGASVEYGEAFDNTVTVKNLSSNAFSQLTGAFTDSGSAQDNGVYISQSRSLAIRSILGAQSASYDDVAEVQSNNVTIEDSELYFGYIASGQNNAGGVSDGHVVIRNSHLKPIRFFAGDESSYGNVSYISGGIAEGEAGPYAVTGNTIELVDSKLDVETWGEVQVIAGGSAWTAVDVHDNAIVLRSTSDAFDGSAYSKVDFYGAKTMARSYGNALVLDHWSGTVGSVQNFDTIVFRNFQWENGKILLEVNDQAALASTQFDVELKSVRFNGELEDHFGEKVILIESTADSLEFNSAYDEGIAMTIPSSLTKDAKGVIANNRDKNAIEFRLEGTVPSRQLELVSNNRNMGLFFVNHGAELILDNLDATQTNYQWGMRTFASIDGVQSNYKTHGHMDVHGFTAAAGLANSVSVNGNPLLLNAFVETGEGDYSEKMSYMGLDRSFSGEVRYYGAGLSMQIKNVAGWYAEGSLRAGKIKTQVNRGLIDGSGFAHSYAIDSDYWAAHVGIGHVSEWQTGKKLDVFAKYFYTYLPNDSATIDADGVRNRFDFASVSSSRVRVGARAYFAMKPGLWTYTGLAYQYDFTPDVSVEVNGETIANGASMRGAMGIGSLGLRYQPDDSPWVADLKIRGYLGQREGVSAKVQAQYRF